MENKKLKIVSNEMRVKLRGDFPNKAYKAHPTKSYLTTLKAMYITERLNDVFGIGEWTFIHEVIKEAEGQVLIKGKLVFLQYDINISEQYGSHAITGKGVDLADGYKSAITDCISKSASYLEIGIDMFKGEITPGKKKELTIDQYNKTKEAPIDQIVNVLNKFDMSENVRNEFDNIIKDSKIETKIKEDGK